MVILFVFLLIVVPIVELAVMVVVANAIGVLPMLGLLLLGSLIGAGLLWYQGRSAWRRFREALATGKPPTREVVDGALVVCGATALIVPGFVTDAVGLLLLFPGTRAPIRGVIVKYLTSNLVVRAGTTAYGGAGMAWQRRGQRRGAGPGAASPDGTFAGGSRPYDVEGSAVEVDQRRLDR